MQEGCKEQKRKEEFGNIQIVEVRCQLIYITIIT